MANGIVPPEGGVGKVTPNSNPEAVLEAQTSR
jgi:hypothetical protein